LLVGDYLFVSKINYGPKLPNTPISFPFAHHTLPLTKNAPSYLEWISMPYKRLAGLSSIKKHDVVVFNFPEGDTMITEYPDQSYYAWYVSTEGSLSMNSLIW
jgi:signal peptidase I